MAYDDFLKEWNLDRPLAMPTKRPAADGNSAGRTINGRSILNSQFWDITSSSLDLQKENVREC